MNRADSFSIKTEACCDKCGVWVSFICVHNRNDDHSSRVIKAIDVDQSKELKARLSTIAVLVYTNYTYIKENGDGPLFTYKSYEAWGEAKLDYMNKEVEKVLELNNNKIARCNFNTLQGEV